MPYGDAAYAGRSGQKESVVALASRFLTGKSKIGNEVATLSNFILEFCLCDKHVVRLGVAIEQYGTNQGTFQLTVLYYEGR